MTVEVERRFEVRGRALGAVEALLQAAAQEGEVGCARTRLERPPLLDVRLRGPASAVAALHDRVRRVPGASLFRDLVVTTPGAETYPDPDVLLRIGLDPAGHAALPTATPPEPVVVAIVDSGIMARHPDLQPHVAVPDRARDATDEDGHGTMLAGSVIAAAGGSATVRLMPVKFFDGAVLPAADNAARAIRAAVAHGAAILNLSWDVGFGSDALRAAVREACAAGCLVVIAAGNDGSDNDRFPAVPACYAAECPEQVITVMATDRYGQRAWFSNYGRRTVDLAAPGVGVLTTRAYLSAAGERRAHRRHGGTSAAAALVAGAAALLKSRRPTLSAVKLKDRLVETADALPPLPCASGGRLDVAAALR